jgi:hypothetical protein
MIQQRKSLKNLRNTKCHTEWVKGGENVLKVNKVVNNLKMCRNWVLRWDSIIKVLIGCNFRNYVEVLLLKLKNSNRRKQFCT